MNKEKLEDMTLLLLYLTGWEEEPRGKPGAKLHRAWKGHPFDLLNALEENKMLSQNRRSKSVVLTPEGKEKARQIEKAFEKVFQ